MDSVTDISEQVESLQNFLIAVATGGQGDATAYRELRNQSQLITFSEISRPVFCALAGQQQNFGNSSNTSFLHMRSVGITYGTNLGRCSKGWRAQTLHHQITAFP